jgi:hypothetical protein
MDPDSAGAKRPQGMAAELPFLVALKGVN